MQLSPAFTGAAGSPFTATIISFFVATIMPQPVPQNLHTALSHFQPASVFFTMPNSSSGTIMPAAVAAETAAVILRNSLLDSDISCLLDIGYNACFFLLFCVCSSVPLFVKLFYLLELFLAHPFKVPFVPHIRFQIFFSKFTVQLRTGHVFYLRQEFRVEIFCNIIDTVPPCVIRTGHGCTVACASSLVMPQLEVNPVKLAAKIRFGYFALRLEFTYYFRCRDRKFIVI